jgi:hypothetical protein
VLALREPSPTRDQALSLALARRPDWQRVVELASIQGVLPLLAAFAQQTPLSDAMPVAVRHALDTRATAVTLKTRVVTNSLLDLLKQFRRHGIEPLVLKGPALASLLYPDPALRPCNDLDLLCPAHQLSLASSVLRAQGYLHRPPDATAQDDFHVRFRSASTRTVVELHADLLQLGLPTRCLASLWEHTQPVNVQGVPALTLAPEHQLLHLCVHLHTHGYGRLIWFKDLDLLLRRYGPTMNWPIVSALARDEGVTTSIRHALALLTALLDTPIPEGALRHVPRDPLGELAHGILWPRRAVLALHGKQRLRSVRFNPRLGYMGVLPSLVVMGRRSEKLSILVGRRRAAAQDHARASQPECDREKTEAEHPLDTLNASGSAPSVSYHPVKEPTPATAKLPASRGDAPIMGE